MKDIENFLSEESVALHIAYLEDLRARCSVMEKCYPHIKNKDIYQISRIRDGRLGKDKREILRLKGEILCHEIYFSSFGDKYQSSIFLREKCKSEACFLYELYNRCVLSDAKYKVIAIERGEIRIFDICDYSEVANISRPLLAIDLCEHSYFNDYRFDRKGYLENAIARINLKILDGEEL